MVLGITGISGAGKHTAADYFKKKGWVVLDADKLLDHVLYLLGYRGNLGAKLKKAAPLFSNVNKVWGAHKVRNNIAHQINFQVNEKMYKDAMLSFKQAFKDLKIF